MALCRLFSFAEAAEAFLLAYQENPAFEEAALSYLAALRMTVSEEEYITFIVEHPMWHEQSLEVEKRLEKSRIDYENSEEYKKLTGVLERRDTEYYKAVSEKLTQMQRDYRKMVEQS